MVASRIKTLIVILALSVLPTLFIWAPFFFRVDKVLGIPVGQGGMQTIVANYDGPLFIIVAKTLYNKEAIKTFPLTLPTEYYAAHFPVFPLLIKTFAAPLGFPYAMLFVTMGTSALALLFFYKFIGQYMEAREAMFLTGVFAVLPARWLVVRSVGSAEPLFVAAILASLYYFQKRNYLFAAIWGAVAQLTKSPAILLFVAYGAYILFPHLKIAITKNAAAFFKDFNLKILPLLLIPLSLLGLFIFYQIRMGDFLAYFHSGDNIHLFFPPFQIFNYTQPWVGTFWLEEIIFIYLIGMLGLVALIKKGETLLAWVFGIFFTSLLFVSHRDLMRYALPIVPLLFVAFSETLLKKEFKYVMILLIVPIYLFSLAYISGNVMQISDWGPFL